MLEDLTIKDFALITSSTLEVGAGFTVLSGETGAGKSILIGALSFLLGGKADTKMIRSGAHEASVAGTFVVDDGSENNGSAAFGNGGELGNGELFGADGKEGSAKGDAKEGDGIEEEERPLSASKWLECHGIEAEEGRVLVRRTLRENGKSVAWIGGVPVTRADLVSFSALLVDIHGQHDHQLLMKVSEHRRFLDTVAGIESEVKSFTALYAQLVEKRRKIEEIVSSSAENERKREVLTFAVQEITDAKLSEGEDEDLADEENRLSSYEKLCSSLECVTSALEEGVNNIKTARRESSRAAEADRVLAAFDNRLEAAFYEISDISEEFTSYKDRLVFDPARLEEVQERLSLIYNLKKKYAPSPAAPLQDVINYAADAQKKLSALENASEDKTQLEAEVKQLESKVYEAAKALSAKRKAAGERMAHEVEEVLQHLGMASTRFCVEVADKGSSGKGAREDGAGVQDGSAGKGSALKAGGAKAGASKGQRCGPYGMDDVEFLISANVAAPLMPLAQIASGGELSRVMLALKTIIAERDPVPTLVFDEIDTGIGGEVAVAVGKHLSDLARFKQILCITHLASIAVYADNQIKIEKAVCDSSTVSACHTVSGAEREKEIARMLSGEESEEAVEHARAMLARFARGGA